MALISILAAAETGRSATRDRSERLLMVLESGASRLRREIVEDQTTVVSSAVAQADDSAVRDPEECRRVVERLRARHAGRVAFVIADSAGGAVCALNWTAVVPTPGRDEQQIDIVDGALRLTQRAGRGWTIGLSYPAAELRRMSGAVPLEGSMRLAVQTTTGELLLENSLGRAATLLGRSDLSVNLTGYDLTLSAAVPELPPTAAQLVAILLPILMLIGSAAIGWLLVHRLFVRQLAFLSQEVAAYRPGALISLGNEGRAGATEVHELGTALHDLSALVAANIANVEAGLERQTALTREVHHRVKNNLQVIASLISLHSRAADDPVARAAYRAIQRRVDALSVVHRNHYAGTEVSTGVSLSALISELASSLESSAETEAEGFSIVVSLEPASVSQDTATSLAFLLTELTEMAMTVDGGRMLAVDTATVDDGATVRLTLRSGGFIDSPELTEQLDRRYGRVMSGLSRQLRTPLEHDGQAGTYAIQAPTLRPDSPPV